MRVDYRRVEKYNGFDSKKEYVRWQELKMLEQCGAISNLEYHKRYELVPDFELNGTKYRKMEYEADFSYTEQGQQVVEDAKGFATDVYKLKKKLMAFILKIEVREV